MLTERPNCLHIVDEGLPAVCPYWKAHEETEAGTANQSAATVSLFHGLEGEVLAKGFGA